MNYEYRICCFIDILGFKSHIDSTVDGSGNDVEDKIKSVKQIIDIANKILIDYDSGVSKSKMVTQFSDSIVISFRIEETSEVFYSLIDLLHIAIQLWSGQFPHLIYDINHRRIAMPFLFLVGGNGPWQIHNTQDLTLVSTYGLNNIKNPFVGTNINLIGN